jgi:hypothetical protein
MIASSKTETAERIKNQAKSRNNFPGKIKVTPIYRKPSFSGVTRNLNDINVTYNPDYPDNSSETVFVQVLDAVIEHEILHREDARGRGCPKKEELDLDKILTPISRKLKENSIPNVPYGTQGHTIYTYFANLFEDFCVNTIGVENRGSEGFFRLYEDMMIHTGCSELFEAFIKLQGMVFPDKTGASKVIKHFSQSEKAHQVYRKYLDRTGLMKIEKHQRADYLANPEHWETLSEFFADEFSKLLDLNDLQSSWVPLFGGNDFKKLDDEDVQMEIAVKAYRASAGQFEPPAFMDNNLALLSLYHHWAKKMEIKSETSSMETRKPIAYVGRRAFDFEKDSLEGLSYGLDSKGKLQAQIGRFPVQVVSRYQISAGHFPDVRVGFLDCSSSTQDSVTGQAGKILNPWAEKKMQWSDTSIYHSELKCFFGLCELFRRKGTLKNSNVRLGSFSSTTRLANNLSESEKLALQPAFGGTVLDEAYVKDFFAGQGSLLYTISDGDISNWNSVKDLFIESAKRHHYFHLQIGKETKMYRDLKKAGLVAKLDDGRNSDKILIDLTLKDVYGGS